MTTALPLDAGLRLWIGGHSRLARAAVEPHLVNASRPPDGLIDLLVVTPFTSDEFVYFVQKHRPRLRAGGGVWLVTCSSMEPEELESAAGWMRSSGFESPTVVDSRADVRIDAWRETTQPPPQPKSP